MVGDSASLREMEREAQARLVRAQRRDEFAKAALQGVFAGGLALTPGHAAHLAKEAADAMLAELDAVR